MTFSNVKIIFRHFLSITDLKSFRSFVPVLCHFKVKMFWIIFELSLLDHDAIIIIRNGVKFVQFALLTFSQGRAFINWRTFPRPRASRFRCVEKRRNSLRSSSVNE